MGRKKRGRGGCDNAPAATPQAQAQAPTLLGNPKQLREVKGAGLFTDDEYEAAKRRVADSFSTGPARVAMLCLEVRMVSRWPSLQSLHLGHKGHLGHLGHPKHYLIS